MDERRWALLRVFDLDGVADYKAAKTCRTASSASSRSRALATNPSQLLLLDEPAAGMNPNETEADGDASSNRPHVQV